MTGAAPGGTPPRPQAGSLRLRWLLATWAAAALVLVLAGVLLANLFKEQVQRQFAGNLTAQLDLLTARFGVGADGQPQLDAPGLLDPRWQRPFSGLYWQIDRQAGGSSAAQRVLQRSRSLWDTALQAPSDALADGAVHQHVVPGPQGTQLLLLERTVQATDPQGARSSWRLLVAGDLADTLAAAQQFNRVLGWSLLGLAGLLGVAAWAQVAVGLAPLRALQRALGEVHAGRRPRLPGPFPSELQPLVDDFNQVLDRNDQVIARARTQAGNLAHAVKTPLAVMAQAAAEAAATATQAKAAPSALRALPGLVQVEVANANRQVHWHLARARAAAQVAGPGHRTPLAPVLTGLLRAMAQLHARRDLQWQSTPSPMPEVWAFAGEQQDLQEMLGNLLDNAGQWARTRVAVSAQLQPQAGGARLILNVSDDGPGIAEPHRQQVLARGARLDEAMPGSGLGLAITQELASLYGGQLLLGQSDSGGLMATLVLPGQA